MSTQNYTTEQVIEAVNAAMRDHQWHYKVIGKEDSIALIQNLPGLIAVETLCSKAAFDSDNADTTNWGNVFMAKLQELETIDTVDSEAFSFPRATWYTSQTGQTQDGVMRYYSPSRHHVNCSFMEILANTVNGSEDAEEELRKDSAQSQKWASRLRAYILEYLAN